MRGTEENCILHYNFDSLEHEDIKTGKALFAELKSHLAEDEKTYLFLDEIQEVKSWEKVVNSLMADYNVDIYVTGSNSRMMPSEISTYLTGRYVSFRIYPLSFSEYLTFRKTYTEISDTHIELVNYLRLGGFPAIHLQSYSFEDAYTIDNETVYSHLTKLESAYIIHRCSRYDVQGKEILKTQEKFYLADPAFRYSVLGYSPDSVAAMLENIVYLELRRRSYDVYVGKLDNIIFSYCSQYISERLFPFRAY